jgi:hypothetical protein
MARPGRARTKPALSTKRYRAVMGRLVAEEVFVPEPPLPPSRGVVRVEDLLEVGEQEPRVLELLPALLVKRPGMFASRGDLPGELAAAVERLRRGRVPEACFGISGTKLYRAFGKLGRAREKGSRLKAFRLTDVDRGLLGELSDELDLSETDVIRHALRVLHAKHAQE